MENRTPREVAKLQLQAYNAHDLEGYMALFHADAVIYDLPSGDVVAEGQEEIHNLYADRFSNEDLYCAVTNQMEIGDYAIDREVLTGLPGGQVQVLAMYEVIGGLIKRIFFVRA